MNQPSEERLGDPPADTEPASARILPFERPPTDLQRAVQMRAQETLERERERSRVRPAPLRWAIIFLLALVPVVLIFAAVDGFVRAFQHINETYSNMPVPANDEAPDAQDDSTSQEPGVVMLRPVEEAQEAAPDSPAQ
jgi:predicted nucleic acid-binding Zn ribbon protein